MAANTIWKFLYKLMIKQTVACHKSFCHLQKQLKMAKYINTFVFQSWLSFTWRKTCSDWVQMEMYVQVCPKLWNSIISNISAKIWIKHGC
jgi:hypothetical protein